MIQLTEKYWSTFQPDGILFETLVGNLLALEYPGHTFQRTKTTHDGSRDWELTIPLLNQTCADIWFECKFRKHNLAANQVAMTLVMAYVEDAKQIVFFSYSPFNRGFVQKISRFSDRSKIPVRLYGDTALESLILKHWDKLDIKQYFPDLTQKPCVPETKGVSIFCEVYQNGNLIACHNSRERPVVRYNDELTLRVTMVNNSSNSSCHIRLSLPLAAEESYYICDEDIVNAKYSLNIDLPHNGISSTSLHLKLKCFGPQIKLPKLLLEWEDGKKVICPGTIEGQWLAETRLIGRTFYDVLYDQNQCMRKNVFTVAQIAGHSGVGKSRLLHEIAVQGHVHGKQVYQLDNDFKKASFLTFVRELVSVLEGLPILPSKQVTFLSEHDRGKRSTAVRILYDDAYVVHFPIDELARYLFGQMRSKGIWIVLDNVQWMDERSLQLLLQLLSYAGYPSNSGLFLAFNQDYLYSGTMASQLMQTILAYAAQAPHNFRSTQLTGFTFQDALTYLRECLTYHASPDCDDLTYDKTLKKVIDHCGTQPFYLQNMLIYLNQCHVLERTDNTSFLVVSIPEFWKRVQEIPQSIIALLERRIQSATEHFQKSGQENSFLNLCAVLSFTGSIPKSLCRELFGVFSIKRELLDLGLLSVNDDGSFSFYHQYFEQYFQKISPLEQLPQELLESFCNAVEKRRLKGSMLDSYYLARNAMGLCGDQLLLDIMNRIIAWQVPPRLSHAVKEAVFLQLENEADQLPDKLVAECYYAICLMTANREGLNAACSYYEKCYSDFLAGKKGYIKYRDILFPLLREYLLSLGNLNRNQDAITRAKKLLPHWATKEEHCTILEILCISHYAMGQTKEAVQAIQNALQYSCVHEPNYLLLLQEQGKTYYCHPNAYIYSEQICKPWEDAFSIYQKEWAASLDNRNFSSRQRSISVHLNAGVADLIRGRLKDAEEKMSYLSTYIDHTEMPFYEIKLRFFKAAVLLMRDMADRAPGRAYQEICALLDQASDTCVIHYAMQDYPICFYLRASTQLYAGRYPEAIDSYKKTCMVLQAHINSEQEESIWSYFYEDMALRFVQLGIDFPPAILNGIQSIPLRYRVAQLTHCGDPETAILECDRSPLLFCGGPWGIPKI